MKTLNIYLGGSCSTESRSIMKGVANAFREFDHNVYCPFEMKIENAWDMTQEEWAQKVFEKDLEELDKCDVFVMISPGRNSTAGTNFEQGYAYAKGKKIVVLQYTDSDTSLMTFCGCDLFDNVNIHNLNRLTLEAVGSALAGLSYNRYSSDGLQIKCGKSCDTILT